MKRFQKNKWPGLFILAAITILAAGWGSIGHNLINTKSGLSFNPQMTQFNAWTPVLAAHASDADYRKDVDPTEAPKHYIDIDAYNEFNQTGQVATTLDSVILVHGSSFVYDNGILPWATKVTVDTLRACFLRGDWDKAVLTAADLGHYVADGHQPLHLTVNYNGQNTGNTGIHSLYETSMISANQYQFVYNGDSVHVVNDVQHYVLNYIYMNYIYLDSVLAADNYARAINSNTQSQAYKTALWSRSKYFTIDLFRRASHALAELIYTAWVQAGSPPMPNASIYTPEAGLSTTLRQNAPNPFAGHTTIQYTLGKDSPVLLQVLDLEGNLVSTLDRGNKTPGTYTLDWSPVGLSKGVYYISLNTGSAKMMRKAIFIEGR